MSVLAYFCICWVISSLSFLMFWENIISDVSINLVAISTLRILIKFHCSNSNTSLYRMEVGSLYGQSGVWYGISFEKKIQYLYLITYNNNYKNTINTYTIIIIKKTKMIVAELTRIVFLDHTRTTEEFQILIQLTRSSSIL